MNYYVVEIRYALTLDALRAKARASFSGPEDKRRISRNTSMTDKKCFTEHFRMSASDFVLPWPTFTQGLIHLLHVYASTTQDVVSLQELL